MPLGFIDLSGAAEEAGSMFGRGVRQAAGFQSKDELLQEIHANADYSTEAGIQDVLNKIKAVDYQEYQDLQKQLDDRLLTKTQISASEQSIAASKATQLRLAAGEERAVTLFEQGQTKLKALEDLKSKYDFNTPEGEADYIAAVKGIDYALGLQLQKDGVSLALVNSQLASSAQEIKINQGKLDLSEVEFNKKVLAGINSPYIQAEWEATKAEVIQNTLKSLVPEGVDVSEAVNLNNALNIIQSSGVIRDGAKNTIWTRLEKEIKEKEAAFAKTRLTDKDYVQNQTNASVNAGSRTQSEAFPGTAERTTAGSLKAQGPLTKEEAAKESDYYKSLDLVTGLPKTPGIQAPTGSVAGTQGVEGLTQRSFEDSQLSQFIDEDTAQQQINKRLTGVWRNLSELKLELFMGGSELIKENQEDEVQDWIGFVHGPHLTDAESYFRRHPQDLAAFEADPVRWFFANKKKLGK